MWVGGCLFALVAVVGFLGGGVSCLCRTVDGFEVGHVRASLFGWQGISLPPGVVV